MAFGSWRSVVPHPHPTLTMKTYTAPALVEFGDVTKTTADSRENNTDDTFFSLTGPQEGLGGSMDTCVTANDVDCL